MHHVISSFKGIIAVEPEQIHFKQQALAWNNKHDKMSIYIFLNITHMWPLRRFGR